MEVNCRLTLPDGLVSKLQEADGVTLRFLDRRASGARRENGFALEGEATSISFEICLILQQQEQPARIRCPAAEGSSGGGDHQKIPMTST